MTAWNHQEIQTHLVKMTRMADFINERSTVRQALYKTGASPDQLTEYDRETSRILKHRAEMLP